MKCCFYENHEKVRTMSASELFSKKEFYLKFDDDDDYDCYCPVKLNAENKELVDFVEHNKNCVAKLCNKVYESLDDWNPSSEWVIVIARDDKIVEEFSYDYIRGYRDAWLEVTGSFLRTQE